MYRWRAGCIIDFGGRIMQAFTYKNEHGIANLCLDLEDSNVNILSFEVLKALDAKLDELYKADDVQVLKITSAKSGVFIAGANISEIEDLCDEEEAYTLVRQGQQILSKISALPYPTIAIIDGACVGGGLELDL